MIKKFNHINVCILCMFCTIDCFSQITITGFANPTDVVNYFVGTGITVSNISFNGSLYQVGAFSNGVQSGLGMNEGIVLTTGSASYAGQDPTNTCQGCSNCEYIVNTGLQDGDLIQISGHTTISAVSFEFDFISNSNMIEFQYVFSSEEYTEYVGTNYNDVFGIFLSGPSIYGPYSNNAVNIATLPNGIPISINNVNPNINSQYYINNCPYTYNLVYDGFTVVLRATYLVNCNERYHLKIAISNVNDAYFDSGVFLKKGSLTSNFGVNPIIAQPNPVCEGDPVTLTINEDLNYYYVWSTGEEGIGLNSISTNANISSPDYSVTITNNDDCSATIATHLEVDPIINNKPYTNGINNTGEYTYYANVNQPFCFNIQTFDDPGDIISVQFLSPIPNGATYTDDQANQPTLTICWIPTYNDIGAHSFTIELMDDNVCENQEEKFTFTIFVVCPECPIGILYENRTPLNNPLPDFTKAANYIIAGEDVDANQTNGPVETGSDIVIFQAGNKIKLEPGFHAGPGFHAYVDPSTCGECSNVCCENFTGFTFDYIPNIITPDGDGVSDIWYVPDVNHPFCAFNAMGYHLLIKDRNGATMHEITTHCSDCCGFRAPGNGNPIPYSSIFWNGYHNGHLVADAWYYYTLDFYGCNDAMAHYNGVIKKSGNPDKSYLNNDTNQQESPIVSCTGSSHLPREIEKYNQVGQDSARIVKISPNPSSGIFVLQIFGSHVSEEFLIEVYDAKGEQVYNNSSSGSLFKLDLSFCANGNYNLIIKFDNNVYKFNLIKQ